MRNIGQSLIGGETKGETKGVMPENGYSSHFPKGETLSLLILTDFFLMYDNL